MNLIKITTILFLSTFLSSFGKSIAGTVIDSNAKNMTHQAKQLKLKIEAGNPNNLKQCPVNPNAWFNKCWGSITFDNGVKYVGEWKNNKENGLGTYTYPSGSKYVGEFKDGEGNGLGTFYSRGKTFGENYMYVGEFKHNMFHGRGIVYDMDGNIEIENSGIFREDNLIKSDYVDPK